MTDVNVVVEASAADPYRRRDVEVPRLISAELDVNPRPKVGKVVAAPT